MPALLLPSILPFLVGCVFLGVAVTVPAGEGSPLANTCDNMKEVTPPADTPADLRWDPWWRERGDCGLLALWIFVRLEGHDVTLQDIRRLLQVDPEKGCSLRDLHRVAAELGLPSEPRFVEPYDVCRLDGPYILHGVSSIEKNRGHFHLIVCYDSKTARFATIDTTTGKLGWHPKDAILFGYTGYVLLSEKRASQNWHRWAGWSLLVVGGTIISFWSYGTFRRKSSVECY